MIRYEDVESLVAAAFEEDVKSGDITTDALFDSEEIAGDFIAREEGVLCGIELAREIVTHYAPRARLDAVIRDGERMSAAATIATLSGRAVDVLPLERLLLNFMQRLSGIATTAARYVEATSGTDARIYDTRKTTPGWRKLEKYAVRTGGACNHREGLFDAVLTKDNHIALAAKSGMTLDEVVRRTRESVGADVFLQVEVDTLDQLAIVIEGDVDAVLLDNMDVDTLKAAVAMVRKTGKPIETEASGGITLDAVAAVAASGVDRISVGALTHSPQSLDIAFECRYDDA